MHDLDLDALLAGLAERRPRELGRAISVVERGGRQAAELVRRVTRRGQNAAVVGVTGPPGAGKSTLVDRLARARRAEGETVGILAVDPTSPFSGGALLGDRIRMQELYTDPGVFIRSMATRGAMGGLARATRDAVDLLDASGFDWILVETVGVGQDEVDVVRTVDTVVLATVPGLGDEIQAIKAGIMEIADVFVINKSDRAGADATLRDLRSMLQMSEPRGWKPPIVQTVASENRGTEELVDAIDAHRVYLEQSSEKSARRLQQLRLRVETLLKERVLEAANRGHALEEELARGFERHEDPYTLADRLFESAVRAVGAAGGRGGEA
ncbi:MAG TPA: methylmalonyl Co-A mutase-associated GTPase MeaB [Thermoanaerobaculia bacterium]|nr:methylmalonyl Co-A mutase-associated GTPase MeaB [Thermoanaerobaculia bacterium]